MYAYIRETGATFFERVCIPSDATAISAIRPHLQRKRSTLPIRESASLCLSGKKRRFMNKGCILREIIALGLQKTRVSQRSLYPSFVFTRFLAESLTVVSC